MIAVTELRQNIYGEFGAVAKTGKSLLVDYKGEVLKIERLKKPSKLASLIQQDTTGDIDDLVNISWEHEWRAAKLGRATRLIVLSSRRRVWENIR